MGVGVEREKSGVKKKVEERKVEMLVVEVERIKSGIFGKRIKWRVWEEKTSRGKE